MGEPSFIKKKIAERQRAKSRMTERTRAMVEAKHDTDKGLTPEQKRAILDIEERNRDNFTESGQVVAKDGTVMVRSYRGDSDSAYFKPYQLARYGKDAVLTHNHPEHEYMEDGTKDERYGNGMAKRIGTTFSGNDIFTASKYDMAEIRANTPTYTYSLRRGKNGWGASPTALKTYYTRMLNKFKKELKSHAISRWYVSSVKQIDGTKKTYGDNEIYRQEWGRYNTLAAHMAARAVAKKFGLEYTRIKRHEQSAHDAKSSR